MPETVNILCQDGAILVVNKPAGLAVQPGGWGAAEPSLRKTLEEKFGHLWVVHRLDKDTSGVLLLARSADAHRELNRQFEQRQVHKVYHALVLGAPAWDEREVNLPLRSDVGHRHRTAIDEQRGKPSRTHLRVLERFQSAAPPASLVEAQPFSGRTHQIRAHLAAVGFSVLGDSLYAEPDSAELPTEADQSRLMLHAWNLVFHHPIDGSERQVQAPYPADFSEWLTRLRSA